MGILGIHAIYRPRCKAIIFILCIGFIIEVFVFLRINGSNTIKMPDYFAASMSKGIDVSIVSFFLGGIFLIGGTTFLIKEWLFDKYANKTIATIVDRKIKEHTGEHNYSTYYIVIEFEHREKVVRTVCRVPELLSDRHSNGMTVEIAYKRNLLLRDYDARLIESDGKTESRKLIGYKYCVFALVIIFILNTAF